MSDFVRDTQTPLSDTLTFRYPFASAPDIIRSNQKDAYFQGVLLERLSTILRSLYGARFAHTYTSEARTSAELLYLGLTTFVGNRTLGEEYCDIVQVSDTNLSLPSILRRSGYILSTVLLPYGLAKLLPTFRRKLRAKLESSLRRKTNRSKDSPSQTSSTSSWSYKLQTYLLTNLDTLTSPAPIHALTLTAFYFTGAYYHLSKRLFGLRYIFTRRLEPSDQRIGYEVLGVLLVCQLAVQGYLHAQSTYRSASAATSPPVAANAGSLAGGSAVIDGGVEVSLDPNSYSSNNALLVESVGGGEDEKSATARIARVMHTPALAEGQEARVGLKDEEVMGWIKERQQRKCTLCLEPMRDPSVTTCGHVFCWGCIGDWVREKPECPLCRQGVRGQHILPLRC